MSIPLTPEVRARLEIDRQLAACGWQVQNYPDMNLHAQRGVAVREFPLKTGLADYLPVVDGKAIGAIEAKREGTTLSGVHHQSIKYSEALPSLPPAWHKPLPFLYESTGIETNYTNGLDPEPRTVPPAPRMWYDGIGRHGNGTHLDAHKHRPGIVPRARTGHQDWPSIHHQGGLHGH